MPKKKSTTTTKTKTKAKSKTSTKPKVKKTAKVKAETKKVEASTKLPRTPIIAVMGHVDHGKTSLLDAIRGTEVQASEVGGITQNTRAHQITFNEQKITFVDTPGHEAFTDMRSRGAKVTDIVMLVVAADDGVQPQTKESIKFAKESGVPMIIAINKVDLPDTKIDKLKQQLASEDVLLEEYGGDVMAVEVSALKKTGLDELLESILLLAEISELKKMQVKDGSGTAFVLESTLDENLGPVSMMLMKSGEIERGNYVVYADGYSKIREVLDESQQKLEKADEGDPVWIIGIDDVLATGEVVKFAEDEKAAKELTKRIEKGEAELNEQVEVESEDEEEDDDLDLLAELLSDAKVEEEVNYLNVVIRADTQGTLEAIVSELRKLEDDEVKVKVVDSGTGDITEKDIATAKAAHGIVIGFQVEAHTNVDEIARKDRVLVRRYKVIYELLDEVAEVMDSMGEPIIEEVEVARAKVKQPFQLSNGDWVAGSEISSGTVVKGYKIYVERKGERVHDGKITSLKKGKEDVRDVKKGQDCGILIDPNFEYQVGDSIVAYKVEKL